MIKRIQNERTHFGARASARAGLCGGPREANAYEFNSF